MIYLDHAATSFPKPPPVVSAVLNYMEHVGVNPGRGSYLAAASAARVVFDAREAVAQLLGIPDARHLVWMPNATAAINLVLHGYLRQGDHVVVTEMEHNAVWRPITYLQHARDLQVSIAPAGPDGIIKTEAFARLVTPRTRLVVVNHASNICGALQPIAAIRQAIGEVTLLVDAAQTAGVVPIDVIRQQIDLLAVTGHKGLLGPQGTGALYMRPGMDSDIEPLIRGGTGSKSESTAQPDFLPDRYESGTMNAAGIAGLGAAAQWLAESGIEQLRQQELSLLEQLLAGLRSIPNLTLYGPAELEQRVGVAGFNLRHWPPNELGLALDRRFGIACRVGLHCAPMAHRALTTYPQGSVRFSLGWNTTAAEVAEAVAAVAVLAEERA